MPTNSPQYTVLQKSAQAAQAAVSHLLLLENQYELYDFPHFFAGMDKLNARFAALRTSEDPRAKDACAAWDAAIADLAEALNLSVQPATAQEALCALGSAADQYLVNVAAGVRLPVKPEDFGEYWLIPKHPRTKEDEPPMFAEFVALPESEKAALPQHTED